MVVEMTEQRERHMPPDAACIFTFFFKSLETLPVLLLRKIHGYIWNPVID